MFVTIPINGKTWLICGGRDFADQAMFDGAMGDLIRLMGCPSMIVHGAALGADEMGRRWAQKMAIHEHGYPAQWQLQGKSAGPKRNQDMIEREKIDLVVAFPGGRGTADMVARARAANIEVAEIKKSETVLSN